MQQVSFGNLMNSIPKTSGMSYVNNYTNTAPQWQQKPYNAQKLVPMTQDEVSFSTHSTEVEEKKKSTAKKWGILTGAALGLAAAGLIIKGRLKAVITACRHMTLPLQKQWKRQKSLQNNI